MDSTFYKIFIIKKIQTNKSRNYHIYKRYILHCNYIQNYFPKEMIYHFFKVQCTHHYYFVQAPMKRKTNFHIHYRLFIYINMFLGYIQLLFFLTDFYEADFRNALVTMITYMKCVICFYHQI